VLHGLHVIAELLDAGIGLGGDGFGLVGKVHRDFRGDDVVIFHGVGLLGSERDFQIFVASRPSVLMDVMESLRMRFCVPICSFISTVTFPPGSVGRSMRLTVPS